MGFIKETVLTSVGAVFMFRDDDGDDVPHPIALPFDTVSQDSIPPQIQAPMSHVQSHAPEVPHGYSF